MTEKNEYRLQDVILGLRPEYLNLANQLKKLDQCLEVSNQISRYGFQALKNNEDIELYCLFERKLGWIRRNLAFLVTDYPGDGVQHFAGRAHKENGEWQISGINTIDSDEKLYRLVNKKQFDEVANAIYQNSFLQKSNSSFIDLDNQRQLCCTLGKITISEKFPLLILPGELTYYSSYDRIKFSPSVVFNGAKEILDTPIPRDALSSYQQKVIDMYMERALPVQVDDDSDILPGLYEIDEKQDRIQIKKLRSDAQKKSMVS